MSNVRPPGGSEHGAGDGVEVVRRSRDALRELLHDDGVGETVEASVRAILAICHRLGSRRNLEPLVVGPLELIADATRVMRLQNEFATNLRATNEGSQIQIGQDDYSRAIGAARLILMGRAHLGPRKIAIDEGLPRAAVIYAVHRAAADFREGFGHSWDSTTDEERNQLAAYIANVILGFVGRQPEVALVLRTLAVTERADWGWQEESEREGKALDPDTKAGTFVALLQSVGLMETAGRTRAQLKKTVQRNPWCEPTRRVGTEPGRQ